MIDAVTNKPIRALRLWIVPIALASVVLILSGVSVAVYVLVQQAPLSQQRLLAATVEGDVVIRASREFIVAEGRPPKRVEELVPDFLPAVPNPPAGMGPWTLHPRSPYGKDDREFSISSDVLGSIRQSRTGYEQISCYVSSDGAGIWHARSTREAYFDEPRRLRAADTK